MPDTLFDQVHRECRAGFDPPNVVSTYPFEKIGAPGLFTVLYVTVTKLPRKNGVGSARIRGLATHSVTQQPRKHHKLRSRVGERLENSVSQSAKQ